MQIIPFKEPGAWQQQITLSNAVFILYFEWNGLNGYWTMNIFNGNNEPICYGIKVVTNWNLTETFVVSGMPSGDIICQNIINEWIDITRFSMGETNELMYYESDEIENLT